MAAKPSSDFGLAGLLHQKGEGRGVDPAFAVGTQDSGADEALEAVKKASLEQEIEKTDAKQTPMPALRLPAALRPSNAPVKRNVQVLLPEDVADHLKYMAMCERTSQQNIMAAAITEAVRQWSATFEADISRESSS